MPYNFIGKVFRYLVQAAFALVAVIALFEAVVRLLGLYRPVMYFQSDVNYEWVIPGETNIVSGLEGYGHTHYVAGGEISTPYNDGAEVLVFGDSHTEARQVDDEDKFVSVAEKILRSHGRHLNLRNLGRSGADFADYVYFVQQARTRVPTPAAFVIQVDEEDFDWHAFDSGRVNSFAWAPDGKLILVHHSPSADKWTLHWWERIALLYPLRERWNLLRERWNPPAQAPRKKAASESEIEKSVAAEAELMNKAAGGVPVLIVRTSYMPYVARPHSPAAVTFDTIKQVEPWPIVDPAEQFVQLRQQNHRDVRTFWNSVPEQSHFNKDGNAIIGRALADGLEKLLSPQVAEEK